MLDLHCHILPGIDDGPADMAESLRMARRAVLDGITAAVATPHTGNGAYNNSLEIVLTGIARLKESLKEAGIPLKLYPGAEVHLVARLSEKINRREIATINRSRYLLVELPGVLLLDSCKAELFNLRLQGFVPIIAHPERQAHFQKNPESLGEMVEMGILAQVTAQSLLGDFGSKIQRCAEKMLKNRLATILASDAHGAENRAPVLAEAVNRATKLLGNRAEAKALAGGTPRAIVADEKIIPHHPVVETKSLGNIFARNINKIFASTSF